MPGSATRARRCLTEVTRPHSPPLRSRPGLSHHIRQHPGRYQRDRYLGEELAEPDHDDVPNLDHVERLPDASHWVHHDEAERVTQLLIDFFGSARPT